MKGARGLRKLAHNYAVGVTLVIACMRMVAVGLIAVLRAVAAVEG